jgi:hypothetical protein
MYLCHTNSDGSEWLYQNSVKWVLHLLTSSSKITDDRTLVLTICPGQN